MRPFIRIFILLNSLVFGVLSLSAQVQVFHGKPYDNLYSTTFSPDGKHVAQSGSWYVRIYTTDGSMVGEYFDRSPRISFRKEFRFWDIHRQRGSLIAFINNEELAIAEKNTTALQTIKIVGLDGVFKREIKVPMKQKPDEDYSTIDQIILSPKMDQLITVESWTGDMVIRDTQFKEIRRINLPGTDSYSDRFVNIKEIKYLNDGSGFMVNSMGQPLSDGWISYLTLYDRKGNLVRSLMNDKWTKSMDTTYGKVVREKDSRPPEKWDISPDGKSVAFLGCIGKIDPKLLGTYKVEEIHPPGSFKELPHKVAYCIRTIDIQSGKQFESYVLYGGDVTLKNAKEREPIVNPALYQLFFAPNNKDFLGVSDKGLYKISKQGRITEYLPYPNDDDYAAFYKKKYNKELGYYSIRPQELFITPDRKKFLSKTLYTSLYFLDTEGKVLGRIKPYYPLYSSGNEGSPIRLSHTGRYFTLQMDPGKDSLLWDFKTNTITREKANIYWDNKDKEYRMSLEKNELHIKYSDAEAVLPANLLRSLVLFDNKQMGVSDKGLVILDKEGEAVKKHPRSTFWFRFAMHPSLEYYMVPSVDAKVKNMYKVSITGQRISEFWIGGFISTVLFSRDGSLLLGSHDSAGCISIWDGKGKLVDFPGQKEGRFFDLHPDPVLSMAMTRDNRFLFTGTADRILVTDLKTGARATLSLFYHSSPHQDNTASVEFIVSDDKGRFECSENACDRVSITQKGQSRTKALWDDYFTENLLWKFLQGK